MSGNEMPKIPGVKIIGKIELPSSGNNHTRPLHKGKTIKEPVKKRIPKAKREVTAKKFSPEQKKKYQDHNQLFRVRRFSHFALRLSERYDLFITFEDFNEMCRIPIENKIKEGEDAVVGVIYYAGKAIKIATDRRKVLITALPFKKSDLSLLNEKENQPYNFRQDLEQDGRTNA